MLHAFQIWINHYEVKVCVKKCMILRQVLSMEN